MNIKAFLGLEDRTSSTLKSINKAATDTEKTFKTVTKTVYEWTDAAKWINKQLSEQLNTDEELVRAGYKVAKVIEEQVEVTEELADAEQEVQDNVPPNPEEPFDKFTLSVTGANQALELLNKAMNVFNKLQQEAEKWMAASNVQFDNESTLAMKMHTALGASKEDIQSMYDYTSALQQNGIIGDEVLMNGAKQLALSASSTESLKKLTAAAADYAVGEYGIQEAASSYVSVAGYMQRALEGSASMLVRNKLLTQEQADYIDNLSDKTAKENALLQAFSGYLGQNAKAAQTAEGQLKQADNTLGDLQEVLGKKVIPYWNQFKQIIVQIVSPIVDFISANEWLIPVLGGIAIAIGALIIILTIYTVYTKLATAATEMFGVAEGIALGPIILITIAIAALIGILIYLWNTNDDAAYAILLAWDGLVIGVRMLGLGIKTVFYAVVDIVEWAGIAILKIIQTICQIALAPINLVLGALEAIGAPGVHKIDVNFADQAEAQARIHSQGRAKDLMEDAGSIVDDVMSRNASRDQRVKDRNKIDISNALDLVPDMVNQQNDLADTINGVVGTDGSGGKALQTTTNDDLLSDEDIQLLLDVATRDYKLNYQQVTPNITLTFGDVRETADVDSILDQVADRLEEIYDGNLEVSTT